MSEHLHYFRPGEEARMLARCQFGLDRSGNGGATLTYPIQGYPWRRNPTRGYEIELSSEETDALFAEVFRLPEISPAECLTDDLWSDSSEVANGITRDVKTNTLCHTLGVYSASGDNLVYFSMKEDSTVLLSSKIYKVVHHLIAPYEILD
ncbi:hypothetical protein NT6N_24470 [Oceaniferula spumae]|uniref:RES domain-containing protein n=1 Tax=Oceaniferula spumae TaxID=2979115 RepID=A0AAT9FN67_9BACT